MDANEIAQKFRARFFNSTALDLGRVLAATAIFYFHIGLLKARPFSQYGEFAVEYFVMLSGITYLLYSSARPNTLPAYWKYMKKRLAGVLPLFLLTNVILFAASFLIPTGLGRPYSVAEFLASASGISIFLGWKYLSSVMWFIPFIIQVYLLLPGLDWCARRLHPVVLMLAAFLVSALLAELAAGWIRDPWLQHLSCKNWSPITRLPEVCAGLILGRSVIEPKQFWPGMAAVGLYGMLALTVSQLKAYGIPLHMFLPWGGFLMPVILFLMPGLLSPASQLVKPEWIRLLGLASFPFFLMHAAPLAAIGHRFGNTPFAWPVYYLLFWLFCAGLIQAVQPVTTAFGRWGIRVLPGRPVPAASINPR